MPKTTRPKRSEQTHDTTRYREIVAWLNARADDLLAPDLFLDDEHRELETEI